MSYRMGCSVVSRSFGEPVFATASLVRRWLLVEQPGAWGPDAPFGGSSLPAAVAAHLGAASKALGFRVLLLRRASRATSEGLSCFAVSSGPGPTWAREARLSEPAELLGVDLRRLFRGGGHDRFGRPVDEPVHLVCTHGRHDACCAEFGRPLVRSLAAAGTEVWESTHVGGCRFAASLLSFPHGAYFGHVSPDDGPRIVAAYREGRLDLAHYRGRSCYAWVAQAAEFFVRSALGLERIDDLAPGAPVDLGGGEHAVEVAGADGRRHRVRLRVSRATPPRIIGCKDKPLGSPPVYELVSLDEA